MGVVLVLSKHESDSMNLYKEQWMMAVDLLPQTHYSDKTPEQDSSGNMIYEAVQDHLVTSAILTGLAYMSTTQLSNVYLRAPISIIGKVGLRVVPVIGAIALAYSLYQLLD